MLAIIAKQFSQKYLLDPYHSHQPPFNRICGATVSVLISRVVDCGFDPRSGQTKDYEIGICCFSAKT
jgi:hypothetical protein